MSMPDWFLVAWWLLTPAVGILMFIVLRRANRLSAERAAALSYLKGIPPGQLQAWPGTRAPGPTQVAVVLSVLSIVLLVVGWVVLIFNHDWARLWVLNFQIFMVAFGAAVVVLGLWVQMPLLLEYGFEDWISKKMPRLVRPVFVLFGIAAIAAGGIMAIRDLALPRLVIEGHVDSVSIPRGWFSDSEYFVVIDGKRFRSTFEAFVAIHPGRRVRVELGAGSRMIFAADDNALRPVERSRRN